MKKPLVTGLLAAATLAAAGLHAAGQQPPKTMLVLDASGSMWGQIDGKPKIAIAREAVGEMLDGWKGEGKLNDFLKATPVPLRVYGNWQALNYNLQVDQLLRKHMQDEAKRRLNDWAERNKDSRNGKDVKKLLDKL